WLLERDAAKGDRNWSLIKTADATKPISAKQDDQSALTGRTMKQIAAAGDRVWYSNRGEQPRAEPDLSAYPAAPARFVEPMRAKLVSALPEGAKWSYEIKLDGYRALAIKTHDRVTIASRNNNPLNDRFAAIAEACRALDNDTVIDGEIAALDDHGRPSFNLLQNARTRQTIVYFVFDLLIWRGRSLLKAPLSERRRLLTEAV